MKITEIKTFLGSFGNRSRGLIKVETVSLTYQYIVFFDKCFSRKGGYGQFACQRW